MPQQKDQTGLVFPALPKRCTTLATAIVEKDQAATTEGT